MSYSISLKKLSFATVFSVAFSSLALVFAGGVSAAATDDKTAANATQELTTDMVLGDANAPVSIVEYASFTCGHCATFHNLVFDKIKENYIDTGKVKFTFREVYFDKFGLAGSLIARCDGDTEFYYNYSDKLFEKQREWMKSKDEAELLSRFQDIAAELGQTEAKFQSCLSNNKNADTLLAWYHRNAEKDGIRSTPSFIINGEKHSNMSYENMSAIIEAELNK